MNQSEKKAFLRIWIAPRETIRHILNSTPTRTLLLIIVALAGIGSVASSLFFQPDLSFSPEQANWLPFDDLPFTMVWALVLIGGFLLGLISMYWLTPWLYTMVGKWFKGTGTFKQMQIAYVWANVPSMVFGIISLLCLISLGSSVLTPAAEVSGALLAVSLAYSYIGTIFTIWAFVLSLNTISVVHQFSRWSSLGTVLLSIILLIGFVLILSLITVVIIIIL
ncbi:Yip1 family protein [Aureibacillus halotolerans]|uniref:Yip1-like protein n=1 Tax=Aureibacillus halotolerans TaxID=1508390 RepID=A0A4R6U873_9BACI|nr:Yip1 family protein [Aureibacillus halotolerans]TDQ42738.1 Yip1-like protein [Aureibacillus halotolerans]